MAIVRFDPLAQADCSHCWQLRANSSIADSTWPTLLAANL